MLDFACSLYLGLRHPAGSLAPWQSLTAGAPAALVESERGITVARQFARLMGCGRGLISPSTLHLLWDLFGILISRPVCIYIDSEAYPIAGWGAERAVGKGISVHRFPHQDSAALGKMLSEGQRKGVRPLIVSDGLCPVCGRVAPVKKYLDLANLYGGLLILDDTQALGVLGHGPHIHAPYGTGGGGVLPWCDISSPDVIIVSSLAKGFGVPAAVLAGSEECMRHFIDRSETRVHCSPPSMAVISAAERALSINRNYGDELRGRLLRNVRRFKERLAGTGIPVSGGPFPVQTLRLCSGVNTVALYHRMLGAGVKAVLLKGRNGSPPRICFIITALHRDADIDYAADVLKHIIYKERWKPQLPVSGGKRRLVCRLR